MTTFRNKNVLTSPQGLRVCVRTEYVFVVAAFAIPFNLIWNMTMFWKSWILTFWPLPQGQVCVCVWGGGMRAKYLLTYCCIVIAFILICIVTMFWLSWILTFGPTLQGWGSEVRGGGSAGKYLLQHIAAFAIPLIWYATWPYSEKKFNFGLCPAPKVHPGVGPRPWI